MSAAVVGVLAAFAVAVTLLSNLGLRTTARDPDHTPPAIMAVVLTIMGCWGVGEMGARKGAGLSWARGLLMAYRQSGVPPPIDLVTAAGAKAERRAIRSVLLTGVVAVGALEWTFLVVFGGTPWRRAVAASLLLGVVVAMVGVVAFQRARLRRCCSACGTPLAPGDACLECFPGSAKIGRPPGLESEQVTHSGAPRQPLPPLTVDDVVVCRACRRRNRVPEGKPIASAICGDCRAPLLSTPPS